MERGGTWWSDPGLSNAVRARWLPLAVIARSCRGLLVAAQSGRFGATRLGKDRWRQGNKEYGNMGSLRGCLTLLYGEKAHRQYGLSAVNQLKHALQSAALAQANGEDAAFITAALLHDIGHMIHHMGENPAEEGVDDQHEARGADWLRAHFGPEVSEPVRLHVPAKRYLCAVEPDYFGKLAPDSVRSLELQGGPMSPAEVEAFQAEPFHADAVRLRRIDETAKDPNKATPDFDYFLQFVDEAHAIRPGRG